MSIKVQVIFYSMYGHVYRMAEAVVEGAKQVDGAEVSLYQVPELIPDHVLEKHGARAAKAASLNRCFIFLLLPCLPGLPLEDLVAYTDLKEFGGECL